MNAPVTFADVEPFNAFAAYQREREHARNLEALLSRAAMMLDSCARRLESCNVDASPPRALAKEIRA